MYPITICVSSQTITCGHREENVGMIFTLVFILNVGDTMFYII